MNNKDKNQTTQNKVYEGAKERANVFTQLRRIPPIIQGFLRPYKLLYKITGLDLPILSQFCPINIPPMDLPEGEQQKLQLSPVHLL